MCNIKCPNNEDCGNCDIEFILYDHALLSEKLARALKDADNLTDPRVVAASEELNKVAVELQRMGVVIDA